MKRRYCQCGSCDFQHINSDPVCLCVWCGLLLGRGRGRGAYMCGHGHEHGHSCVSAHTPGPLSHAPTVMCMACPCGGSIGDMLPRSCAWHAHARDPLVACTHCHACMKKTQHAAASPSAYLPLICHPPAPYLPLICLSHAPHLPLICHPSAPFCSPLICNLSASPLPLTCPSPATHLPLSAYYLPPIFPSPAAHLGSWPTQTDWRHASRSLAGRTPAGGRTKDV